MVGLVGGLMYVTAQYLVFEDKRIAHERKEVCSTMVTLFFDLGVVLASVFGFVFNSLK